MATQSVKDILDAEIPSPTWALRPSLAAPIRSDMTFTRGNEARTFDPRSDEFEARSANQPRIYGRGQDLLIEANRYENQVLYSTLFNSGSTDWSSSSKFNEIDATSIFNGEEETALELECNGNGGWLRKTQVIGTTSGAEESFFVILEKQPGANQERIEIRDRDSYGAYLGCELDWGTDYASDSIVADYDTVRVEKHRLPMDRGPNGGRIYALIGHGPAPNSGNTRRVDLTLTDNSPSAGDSTIVHYAGIHNHSWASLPIVNDGTIKTPSDDRVTIFSGGAPEWWNKNKMTFIIEFAIYQDNGGSSNQSILGGGDSSGTWTPWLFFDSNLDVRGYDNGGNGSLIIQQATPFKFHKVAISVSAEKNQSRCYMDGSGREDSNAAEQVSNVHNLQLGTWRSRGNLLVRRAKFIPAYFSKTALQAITS